MSDDRRAFAALATCFAIDGWGLANWAARIPAVKAAHHLSSGELGVVLFALAAGAAVSMLWTGALATRLGSLLAVRTATVVYLVGLALLAQPPGQWSLAATAFLFGAGFGAMNIALNAHAVALENGVGRPILARLHAAFSGGGLLGAASGGLAAAEGITPRLHLPLVAAVGASVVSVAWRPLASVDARPAGARMFARPQRALAALGLIAFCSMLGEGAAADWSGVFLHSSTGASLAVASAGYLAFSAAMAAGRLAGDWAVSRYGATLSVRPVTATAAAAMSAALMTRMTAIGVVGFTLLGVGLATVIPQAFRAAARSTAGAPATSVAAVSTLGWGGFLIGPPVIGSVASASSLPLALGLVVLGLALIAMLAPQLEPPSREKAHVEEMQSLVPPAATGPGLRSQ